jgi:hypothetical protein
VTFSLRVFACAEIAACWSSRVRLEQELGDLV